MGRQIIELVQVLVGRIEKNGYQQRAREDDIADVYKRLNEAEGQAKHWRQARQEAIEAGELMRAEIERLRAFVNLSRRLLGANIAYADVGRLRSGLAELDAGTEPTPVAERCPECDGAGMVDSGGFGPDGKGINVPCGGDCRGNPCPSQPTPVVEPLDAEGGA